MTDNTIEGRLANAEREVDKLLEIIRTGAYTEILTPDVVSNDLWNWSTQLVILQKLAGKHSGQTELKLEPYLPARPARKIRTVLEEVNEHGKG